MCGVAGSKNKHSGFDLYQNNLSRGCYSSSVTILYDRGGVFIRKVEGELNLNDVPDNGAYYLFHSRGPTVKTNDFNWNDNHPFICGRFIVAHNGIIENANELCGVDIGVDSRVIPILLDKKCRNSTDSVISNIIDVCNALKGTFGLWLIDTETNIVYVIKKDVTLFNYGLDFSSSNSGYLSPIKSNTLYSFRLSDNLMTEEGCIKSNKSKYFISNG